VISHICPYSIQATFAVTLQSVEVLLSFVASIVVVLMEWTCTERGVVYEFELSARNDVDFGDVAVQTIRTPDGSQYLFPLYNSVYVLSCQSRHQLSNLTMRDFIHNGSIAKRNFEQLHAVLRVVVVVVVVVKVVHTRLPSVGFRS